jgi:hypothetical protein
VARAAGGVPVVLDSPGPRRVLATAQAPPHRSVSAGDEREQLATIEVRHLAIPEPIMAPDQDTGPAGPAPKENGQRLPSNEASAAGAPATTSAPTVYVAATSPATGALHEIPSIPGYEVLGELGRRRHGRRLQSPSP